MREAVVANNDGTFFTVRRDEGGFAIYLPGFWTASSRSSTNARTGAWRTDVVLSAPGKSDVTIRSDSSSPDEVAINGAALKLVDGSVFRVRAEGEIEQIPLAPMPEVGQAELVRLNTLLGAGRQ